MSWICAHGHKNTDDEPTCFICSTSQPVTMQDRRAARSVVRDAAKKRKPIRGNKNLYYASDGKRYTEAQIRFNLSITYGDMDITPGASCDAYPGTFYDDHDHTLAKARCKELHKTELIWDSDNIEYSSRKAHVEWESYKDGKFIHHANFQRRMKYLEKHDNEGWRKRMIVFEAFTKPKETV